MAGGYYQWPSYVPVAERRKKADRQLKKLRKNGQPVSPVTIEGRAIASTFWGKAWCDNLESYRDYEYRLARGRTYVRNGLVVDLQISALEIKALVSGSSVYTVTVSIRRLASALWRSICADCAGGIDSLVELLQGRFSDAVMERICRQGGGLFPKPSEIRLSCTCPDGANLCKHVAAALYGVGARLDEHPELLFRLRGVDENDLVTRLDESLLFSSDPLDAGKILKTADISALFDLDLEGTGDSTANHAQPPALPAPEPPGQKRARKKAVGRRTVGASRRAVADPTADMRLGQPRGVRNANSAKRTSKSRSVGQTTDPGNFDKPTARTPPRGDIKRAARSKEVKNKRRTTQKREFELTRDGFVKWWK